MSKMEGTNRAAHIWTDRWWLSMARLHGSRWKSIQFETQIC